MTHPKTPHLILLLPSPTAPSFFFKKQQQTFTRLCMPCLRLKRGKKRKWPENERKAIAHVGIFFQKLKKLGAGKGLLGIQPTVPFCSKGGQLRRQTTLTSAWGGRLHTPLPGLEEYKWLLLFRELPVVNCHYAFTLARGGLRRTTVGRKVSRRGRRGGRKEDDNGEKHFSLF